MNYRDEVLSLKCLQPEDYRIDTAPRQAVIIPRTPEREQRIMAHQRRIAVELAAVKNTQSQRAQFNKEQVSLQNAAIFIGG